MTATEDVLLCYQVSVTGRKAQHFMVLNEPSQDAALAIEAALTPAFPDFHPMPAQPAQYIPQRDTWLVNCYQEVKRVLSDYTVFTNQRGALDPEQAEGLQTTDANMLAMDPPRHQRYRTLVSLAFTPRTVARMEPRITSVVHTLLDRVQEQGHMDVVDDFSSPLSLTIIADLLGVPDGDHEQFKRWTDAFFEMTTPAASRANIELMQYFQGIIEQRRHEPQDDLISALLVAQVDGQHLTEVELKSVCGLLLLAGNDTTRNLIANTLLCLDEFPDQMTSLRADITLIPTTLEETLRFLPAVRTAPRRAKVDTTIGGQEVKAGQWVMPMLASANRDAEQFLDPNRFNVGRTPNRHLTFGHGVHFCLGAPLARLESRIALEAMLTRFSNIQRDRSVSLECVQSPIVYSLKHLPIMFE